MVDFLAMFYREAMKPEYVNIRTPTYIDAAEIARVHTEVWRSTYGGAVPDTFLDSASVARRTSQWQRVLGTRALDQSVAVSESDGKVIGFAHCGMDDGRRKLFALYVLDAFHGSGAGQRLLDAVLTDEPTELWVAQDNSRAVSFYRRNGFVADGESQDFPGADGLVIVRMVR